MHIVGGKNNAQILDGADITLTGGSLAVAANAAGKYATVGDAVGAQSTAASSSGTTGTTSSASSTGVGAGIAVGVIGIDVKAIISQGAALQLAAADTALDSLKIEATFKGTERTTARAGASGGNAIVPVLALDVSGVCVQAILNAPSGAGALTSTGDATINAENEMTRTLSADAAAAGSKVGVGATLSLSILNDSAEAALNRSLTANNVFVTASSVSHLTSTSKAGAAGADDKTGSDSSSGDTTGSKPNPPDARVDSGVSSGSGLAGKTGSSNVTSSSVTNLGSNRQSMSTTEGSVQVAAAIDVNVQKNVSDASIGDGVTIKALAADDGSGTATGGEVKVAGTGDTDAKITSNASATNSTVGVGVAGAVNVVNYDNLARIGSAAIEAAALNVLARSADEEVAKAAEKTLSDIIDEFTTKIGASFNISSLLDKVVSEITNGDMTSLEAFFTDKLTGVDLGSLTTAEALSQLTEAAKDVFLAKLTGQETEVDIDASLVDIAGEASASS